MTVSIGIKHRDCWHYQLSRKLDATIVVRYAYLLPNRQLYGYQTVITPRIGELDQFLGTLPQLKKFVILSKHSDRAEVITWAEQSSIMESILKTNCVFIGPTVVRDGIENWHIIAPSREELQAVIESIEKHADISYIRNTEESDFARYVPGMTERQAATLAAALEMGYYDSPRTASIRDVATKLGISPSTAVEHLRKAEKKVLENYVHPG